MIDTITIILKRADAPNQWNINAIADRLDKDTVSTTTKGDTTYVNGKIKNIKVRVSSDLLLINGSLTKYFFDNNLQTLSADDIVTAITWLAGDLDMPIWRGYIKRIDVARNIIVSKRIKNYLNCFDDTPGYHRDRIDDRLLYKKSNGRYSVTFYDKIAELKKKDNELYRYNRYGFLKDKNILRYEVKLEQKINKSLKYKSVRVVHLRSSTFLKKLNDFWNSQYKTILTKKNYTFITDVDGYGGFKKELLVKATHDIGINDLFKMLEDLRKSGKLTSNQKAYAKQDIKRLMSGSSSLTDFDDSVELTKEMDFVYKEVEEDVFTHLKNIIVKSNKESKPQKYLYTDFNGNPIELKKRFSFKDAEKWQEGYLWDLPEID